MVIKGLFMEQIIYKQRKGCIVLLDFTFQYHDDHDTNDDGDTGVVTKYRVFCHWC